MRAPLVDPQGRPLKTDKATRREMKSGQIKETPYGNVLIKLVVDLPKGLPEENFKEIMYEYGNILAAAFRKS